MLFPAAVTSPVPPPPAALMTIFLLSSLASMVTFSPANNGIWISLAPSYATIAPLVLSYDTLSTFVYSGMSLVYATL